MRKIRDVLKCLLDQNFSQRKTALYTGINRETVGEIRIRFSKSGLPWPLPEIDDDALELALYEPVAKRRRPDSPPIDFPSILNALKLPGTTLTLLHEEWAAVTPKEHLLGYSQFCRLFERFQKSLQISMRRIDIYGEVAYVDYSGKTAKITNPITGAIQEVQIFVGVLGGSLYTFCEATATQKLRDWVESHIRMFAFFGGVPRVIVPDNLKSAVTKADRFSPVINETYDAMCRYYGTHAFPARAGKPKDKPKAEAGVLLAQRWILARIRNQQFFSLAELNKEIAKLLDVLNAKNFQKLPGSRFSRWLEYESPALIPLPADRYEFAQWGKVRVERDYHVRVDQHFYSVPYQYRGLEIEYRLSAENVEFIHKGNCIASHTRSFIVGGAATKPEHRHPTHKPIMDWSEDVALAWAEGIGPNIAALLKIHLSRSPGYHGGYRATEGMRSLAKRYTKDELEPACAYALANKIYGTNELRSILLKRLYQLLSADSDEHSIGAVPDHGNIRGPTYYEQLIKDVEQDDDEQ